MNRLIQGILRFQSSVYPANRELFEKLSTGQSPETLLITCSDSRIAPEMLTQTGPGEIFVCRNAGNIAPAYGPDAVTSAVEYGVYQLKVKDIVVMGHSGCGAMKAVLNPEGLDALPEVRGWIQHAAEARRSLEKEGIDPKSPEALEAVTKFNIRLQMDHVASYLAVRSAMSAGNLKVHGWYYNIGSGVVEAWDATRKAWAPVAESNPTLTSARTNGQETRPV